MRDSILVLASVLATISAASAEQVKISNPVHPGSNLPILSFSNHDGICKMLGFEKAVAASVVRSDRGPHAKPGMVFGLSVDTNGRVFGYERMYTVAEITCQNADPAFIVPEESTVFENPVHPQTGLPFAHLDRSVKARDLICQALDHDRSAKGLDYPLLANEPKRATLVHETKDLQDVEATTTFARLVCIKVNPLAPIPPPPVAKEPTETPAPPIEAPKTEPTKPKPDESEEEEEKTDPELPTRRPPAEAEDSGE